LEPSKSPDFAAGGFCGEAKLIEKLRGIEGVDRLATQTYTFRQMWSVAWQADVPPQD